MLELRELYQEIIIDHGRRPRNFGELNDANHHKDGYNPLCGDQLTIHIKLSNDVIEDIKFEGAGCAISMASASLLTEALKGKTKTEFEQFFAQFHDAVTAEQKVDVDALGKLAALAGVKEYPMRVKCATLAWHTVRGALDDSDGKVTTE